MASANALAYLLPLAMGSAGAASLSLAHVVDWKTMVKNFATGPGRTSRILLMVFVVVNWKNMPFVWTVCHTRFSLMPFAPTKTLHRTGY